MIFLSIILKSPKVFSVIKICKRSLNGTTIYARKYLIGNRSRYGFFLSLEKDRDVVLSGTVKKLRPYVPSTVVGENIKNFNIQRRTDLKFVPNDIKPSAGFNTKANPTEGGKWKIVSSHWNTDDENALISSPFRCNGKKPLDFSARGIPHNIWGTFKTTWRGFNGFNEG